MEGRELDDFGHRTKDQCISKAMERCIHKLSIKCIKTQHNGIKFSNKKEYTTDTYKNMD